jgi:hypothetical protein
MSLNVRAWGKVQTNLAGDYKYLGSYYRVVSATKRENRMRFRPTDVAKKKLPEYLETAFAEVP